MPTDWNKKLALLLSDPPDKAFDVIHRAFRNDKWPEPVAPDQFADWYATSADRPCLSTLKKATDAHVAWAQRPELTHPISAARSSMPAVDLDKARASVEGVVRELETRFVDNPKARFLWIWRYLADELVRRDPSVGQVWYRFPAEAAVPDHTVWSHMTLNAAIGSVQPSPAFLVFDASSDGAFASDVTRLTEIASASSLVSWLAWQSMLAIVEELGPDAIVHPSLRYQPIVDQWLSEQGVTWQGASAQSSRKTATLPGRFVALVPADRVEELGQACVKRWQDAWRSVAGALRKHLEGLGWAVSGDTAWDAIWTRQIDAYWDLAYTGVAWTKDSTGAASLLAKPEMDAYEKWARQRTDFTGEEDPGVGAYYGLWYAAAHAAAASRRQTCMHVQAQEPGDKCSLCLEREALHGDLKARQNSASSSEKARAFWRDLSRDTKRGAGLLRAGDKLCAVCSMKRMAQSLPEEAQATLGLNVRYTGIGETLRAGGTSAPKQVALLLINADQLTKVLRGGKDLKGGVSLRTIMDSAVPEVALRSKPQWKDLLDFMTPAGPARQAALAEALGDYFGASVPEIVEAANGMVLYSRGDEALVLLPVARAVEVAKQLRERYRQPYVECKASKRLTIHPGPAATLSAVIMIARSDDSMRVVLREARQLLERIAKDRFERDALVLSMSDIERGHKVFGCKWDELDSSVDPVVRALREEPRFTSVSRNLAIVSCALVNRDLDKASPDARLGLVRSILSKQGASNKDRCVDDDALARGLVALIDKNKAAELGDDDTHALDGIDLACHLAGGQ